MTPEEKNKIYQEEKERLKVREMLQKDSKKKQAKKGCIGCLGFIVIAIIIGSIAGLFTFDEENIEATKEIRFCKSDGVNIRTGLGTQYDIDQNGQLFKGEKLYVHKDSDDWISFSVLPNDTSWTGWVKKDFTVSKAQWDLDRYIDAVNKLQSNLGVELIDQVSVSGNKATITVTNLWHIRHKQLRLQDAQTLWKIWANINSPSDPDNARIKIVDANDNKVGGSKYLGGSVIEVDD